MKAGRYLFIVLLFLGIRHAAGQSDSVFSLKTTIHGDIVDFTVDKLGNIYLLNSDNQLKKVSETGDSIAVFNIVKYMGKLYSVDATNPLKILLYYREFATIVEVDRFLNILNTIDLRNLNIYQAKAVGRAYDNNIWVYDELEAKLKRIADDGTLVDQTPDIRQLTESAPEPSILADQGGYVFLYDSTKGLYIFDHYGFFQKQVPITGWEDVNVIEKNVLGRADRHFYRYQVNAPGLQQEPIPDGYLPAIKILVTPQILYVLKHGGLYVYSRR
jgi:hypothetical protein